MSLPNELLPVGLLGTGAADSYQIERSLRFNSADSAYLSRTPASAGNRKTWTWAGWVKRSMLTTASRQIIFTGHNAFNAFIGFSTDDKFEVATSNGASANYLATSAAVFRDVSAWAHIVVSVDTTQATESNRAKLWINNVQQTLSGTIIPQNGDTSINLASSHRIGSNTNDSLYFAGYLAEIHFIDGQALDPTSFGQFDANGIWQPIEYTGTYGTNGFYLPFSDNSTAAALGTDTSGNENDWTVNNLAATGDRNYTQGVTFNAPNGFVGNPLDMFDSSLTSGFSIYCHPSNFPYIDIQFNPAIPASTSFEFYSTSGAGPTFAYSVNGGSNVQFQAWSAQWVNTGSYASVSSLRVSQISGNFNNPYGFSIYAIRANGNVLIQFSESDSLVDTPTNGSQTDTGIGGEVVGNYATFNPLNANIAGGAVLTNGNLSLNATSTQYVNARSTIAASSLNCYCEMTVTAQSNSNGLIGIGVGNDIANIASGAGSYTTYRQNGEIRVYPGNTLAATVSSYTQGDVIGMTISSTQVAFYKNNTLQGTYSHNLTGNFFALGMAYNNGGTAVVDFNFGQRPFVYTAPSGYKALCTTNLPEGSITTSGTFTGNSSTDGPFVYLNGVPTAMTINGNAVTFGTHADKLSNGFKVRDSTSSYNTSGSNTYSISSTGDKFKVSRAQANP